jgi:hypothetical protein
MRTVISTVSDHVGAVDGGGYSRGGRRQRVDPLDAQPLPSVEPAFDLAGLLDELDASVRPALLSEAFEGLDDRDDDFAMMHSYSVAEKQIT